MKNLFLFLLLFVFVSAVSAQSPAGSQSDLKINKKKWSFKKYALNDHDLNEDTFKANDDLRTFGREITDTNRENAIRRSQGLPPLAPPTRNDSTTAKMTKEQLFYTEGYFFYEINITNSAQKNIVAVTWDYVFFDVEKKMEAGRREFRTVKNISPGESKTLSEKSTVYPTLTIDASKGDRKFADVYSEQIVIKKIEYSDGSAWNAPSH